MEKISIFDVADWFLSKEPMTNKKLQKLCYYAYSWFIYLYNDDRENIENRLFDDKFQAWVHGPVNTRLYHKYKNNGFRNIEKTKDPMLSEEYNDFLEKIWNEYGDFNGDQLETISHQELPWIKAREGLASFEATNKEIEEKDIFMEYSER